MGDPPSDLTRLPVLVVDCQTTGATPERGHLLEVAWARLPAAAPRIRSTLVALPAGERIPTRIESLTGIAETDLVGAPSAAEVWAAIAEAASFARPAPAVAHFARFERAFLEALHADHGDGRPFPLDLLCTHEIACRLLPGLPRRGLKALAGHLGLVLGETKRAAAHVEASVVVWGELARRLAAEEGVTTLEALRAWLEETPARRRGGRDFAVARAARLDLPDAPGVYRMLGRGGEVLYLGKATSLKRRVNGYFQKRRHGRRHTLELLTQVFSVEVEETATPLEAALREADEIKRLHPPYNVQLRERDPAAYFAGDDLARALPRPDARHGIGPLPAPDALRPLAAAAELVRRRRPDAALFREALDLEAEAEPDVEVLVAGLRAFGREAGLAAGRRPSLGALLGVGARLWRAWMAQRDAEAEEEETEEAAEAGAEDEAEEEAPGGAWVPRTPEEAQAALAGVVRRGAHLVRRARWLRLLGNASLAWQPAGGRPRRLLVLDDGKVVRADDAPTALPAPPGWPRRRLRRLAAFDAATCDRLRVLTTALKRLVAAGGDVRLRLAPRTCLDRDALAARLFWL